MKIQIFTPFAKMMSQEKKKKKESVVLLKKTALYRISHDSGK